MLHSIQDPNRDEISYEPGAHIAFNLVTGIVALAALPGFLWALITLRNVLSLDSNPVAILALFHTAFNISGVLLMWPLNRRLVVFLERRFRVAEEEDSRPKYLDRNVASTPILGLQAMVLELKRIGNVAHRMIERAVSANQSERELVASDRKTVDHLVDAVGEFSHLIRQHHLPRDLSELLPNALRISRYYTEIAELCEIVARARGSTGGLQGEELTRKIRSFETTIRHLAEYADQKGLSDKPEDLESQVERMQCQYQELKARILNAGADGEVSVRRMVDELDVLSNMRRIGEQVEKGQRFLRQMQDHIGLKDGEVLAE